MQCSSSTQLCTAWLAGLFSQSIFCAFYHMSELVFWFGVCVKGTEGFPAELCIVTRWFFSCCGWLVFMLLYYMLWIHVLLGRMQLTFYTVVVGFLFGWMPPSQRTWGRGDGCELLCVCISMGCCWQSANTHSHTHTHTHTHTGLQQLPQGICREHLWERWGSV